MLCNFGLSGVVIAAVVGLSSVTPAAAFGSLNQVSPDGSAALTNVRGGGGGHGGSGGGGHVGGGGGHGGGGFGGGSRFAGASSIHGFHGGHGFHHGRFGAGPFFGYGYYGDYDGGCWYSRRYRERVCPGY